MILFYRVGIERSDRYNRKILSGIAEVIGASDKLIDLPLLDN
jgi:hypothetical protein